MARLAEHVDMSKMLTDAQIWGLGLLLDVILLQNMLEYQAEVLFLNI